jgi:steroid delta-isomerase-like uncharacterized protein
VSEHDNVKAAHSFFEAWNSGDLSKSFAYEAEDMTAEGPGMSGQMSREMNHRYLQNFLTAFPGSKFQVLFDVAQGDFVVTNWKVSGKHMGPLQSPSGQSIAPTGKPATLVGSTTYQVKNGKIVRSWTFWDLSSLLGQIGLLPPM